MSDLDSVGGKRTEDDTRLRLRGCRQDKAGVAGLPARNVRTFGVSTDALYIPQPTCDPQTKLVKNFRML